MEISVPSLGRAKTLLKTLSAVEISVVTMTAVQLVLQALSATATTIATITRKPGQLTKGAKTILNLGTRGLLAKIKDKFYIDL